MVEQYLKHSREILTSPKSKFKGGSKGMGLISLFGYQNEYDLREGFPLLTTKKMSINPIAHELIWFMRGESNIRYLVDNDVHIWDDNAFDHNLARMVDEKIFSERPERYSSDWHKANSEYVQRIKEDSEFAERWGDLGPVYGSQWRKWKAVDQNGKIIVIDQLGEMIENIRKKPTGKRNLVTAWNPGEVPNMALPPCHVIYHATSDGEDLDLLLYQRSCDMFLGVPFNIASYAMLTQIIAQQTGLKARRFIHTFGDSHFYCADGKRSEWYGENMQEIGKRVNSVKERLEYLDILDWVEKNAPLEVGNDGVEREGRFRQDHVTAILNQLSREPRKLPKLEISDKSFDKLTIDDFKLIGYEHDKGILRAMAV
jgi:thymidylate synthase